MNTFDIILQQVGLFVIYILAGLLLVKTKVLNRETLEPISKFVIKMALPLMVFINITDGTDKKNLYGVVADSCDCGRFLYLYICSRSNGSEVF